MRIFIDMANTEASSHTSSRPRNRPATASVPVPETRSEASELRELLETYLVAMQALLEEHRRTLARSARATEGIPAELIAELRALADHRAPWVNALAETRALLFVALRELIVGDNEAGLSIQLPAQLPAAPKAGPDELS